jgi:tetratricopeptide (TPR) repeat protein
LLKGCLSTLTFHFEAAQEAYKEALRYLKREADRQLWAATQVEVGGTHAELGIRGEGKAANEHLTDAITAYRNALEVYTRERLPQDWAAVQTNLGNALQAQGLRTGGSQGNELLAQAVAAYRCALEVYTPEGFPAYHVRVEANLAKAEDLPLSVFRGNKYLDWKGMIDHIGVVVLVMLISLLCYERISGRDYSPLSQG